MTAQCQAVGVPDRQPSLRGGGRLLACACLAAVAAGCSTSHGTPTSTAAHRPRAAASTTTSAPLSAASFTFGPCADIVTSPDLTPHDDLRPLLLAAADVPSGTLTHGPDQTSTSDPTMAASVPSTSPAAYETITLDEDDAPGGTATLTLAEVVGDVGSPTLAAQMLTKLDAAVIGPHCSPASDVVILPGFDPPVTVAISGGQASSGSVRSERLFTAQGSRLLCLTWTSDVAVNASGVDPEPALPALPDTGTMSQELTTALAHLGT